MNTSRLNIRILMLLSVIQIMVVTAVPAHSQSRDTTVVKSNDSERTPLQRRVYNHYLDGVTLRTMGSVGDAARAFYRSARLDPYHYASYYQLAIIARDMGKMGQAVHYASAAYDGAPTNRDYADLYGRLLGTIGDYAAAERIFAKLATDNPSDIETQALWAMLLMQTGNADKALRTIDAIENQHGIQPQLIDIKRQVLLATERYADAYNYLEGICDEFTELDASVYASFADLAATLRMDSLALANYHKAISIDPQEVLPLYSLAEYYRIKGQGRSMLESLVPLFENANFRLADKISYYNANVEPLIMNPEGFRQHLATVSRLAAAIYHSDSLSYNTIEFYARYMMRNGMHDEAHNLLVSSIDRLEAQAAAQSNTITRGVVFNESKRIKLRRPPRIRPEELPSEDINMLYTTIISIAQYRKQPDTVEHYISRAERLYPRSSSMAVTRMFINLERGDTLGAVALAHRVAARSSNDSIRSIAMGFCGDMEHMWGNDTKSFRHYRQALKYNPNNSMVLNNYAYFLCIDGRDFELALAMSEKANELSPSNPTYLDTKAWILYQMGRYDEAQVVIRQAIALQSEDNPELLLHYGDILYALGQTFLAKNYWQRALDAGTSDTEVTPRMEQIK